MYDLTMQRDNATNLTMVLLVLGDIQSADKARFVMCGRWQARFFATK